jgi:hypothetical protein
MAIQKSLKEEDKERGRQLKNRTPPTLKISLA